MTMTREAAQALDRADPLAEFRVRFVLPENVVYLDGNSLGALPIATLAAMERALREEWGQGLIRSWNEHWVDLPLRTGAMIARLIGAKDSEVVVADSTSINLFKLLAAAMALRPDRRVLLAEHGSFPTDLYMAQGLAALTGRIELRLAPADELTTALDDDVAVLMVNQVDYRTGRLADMAGLTRAAHEAGALALFDLAHSAGALPVDLNACSVDLAVGCGYKFLNGGPGAPAFLFVAERHQERAIQPLSGWFGHDAPFAFEPAYRPAPGIARFQCGTPPVLALRALEAGLRVILDAGIERLRAKSVALTDAFLDLAESECAAFGVTVASPRPSQLRGSQVALRHEHGYPVMQALIARGVIGDFREPDILRFGFAPLYNRFVDIVDAIAQLRDILGARAWDRPEFRQRAKVT